MDATTVAAPHVARPLTLLPFTGLRLAGSRVGDPTSGRMFARPYRAVGDRLVGWERRGLLTRDPHPVLYLHEYRSGGRTIRGLVGALDVSRRARRAEDRAVLPHEAIYPAQADDLADRMGQMGLNPAPILLVQHAPADLRATLDGVRGRLPEHQFVDRRGECHRLWVIRDRDEQLRIADQLAPTTALVADGHHRYAAYLRLHQRDPREATSAGIAMLVDQDATPLRLGAIHRVLVGTRFGDVLDAARLLGIATEPLSEAPTAPLPAGRLIVHDGESWAALVMPDGERSAVEVLHEELVPTLAYGPTKISYHHEMRQAVERAGPAFAVAVLLGEPSFDRVMQLARADRLLPEKATSFQPKPPLGVLMRQFAVADDHP